MERFRRIRRIVGPLVMGLSCLLVLCPVASGAELPPVLEGLSVSHLTPTNATLEARINTEGQEFTYGFNLGSSPCSVPQPGCEELPSGKLLGSFVTQNVSLDLNSAGVTLTPSQVYGYSVTLGGALGAWQSPWQQFLTPPSNEPEGVPALATNAGAPTTPPLVAPGPRHRPHKRHRRSRRKARRALGLASPAR